MAGHNQGLFFGIAVIVLSLMPLAGARAQSEKELLESTLRKHAAAVGSIRTLHCRDRVETNNSSGARTAYEASLWKSLDRFLVTVVTDPVKTTTLIEDGRVISVSSGAPTYRGQPAVFIDTLRPTQGVVVWDLVTLPTVYGSENSPMPMTELLTDMPDAIRAVKSTPEGVTVEFDDSFGRREVTFDPSVNYMIGKVSFRMNDGKSDTVTEYQYVETAEAVFFPKQVTQSARTENQPTLTTIHTITDVEVNRPIQPSVFDIRFPPGAIALDRTRNQLLQINNDGTLGDVHSKYRITDVEPLVVGGDSAGEPIAVTEEAQTSLSRWLIPTSIILLLLAGCVWLFRRYRSNTV